MATVAQIRSFVADKRGHSEVLDCPICHGKLHLSFAGTRRHVRARCETPDCIAFIQ